MRTLFADLDGTLIYSHRVELPGAKRCVERLNGRPQSFMTQRSFAYFCRERDFTLVPTTTRSPQQFTRLRKLMQEIHCRDALICHGGILLHDGESDAAWLAETKELAGTALSALSEATKLLRRICGAAHVFEVEGLLVYGTLLAGNPPVEESEAQAAHRTGREMEEQTELLRKELAGSGLTVLHDARKIYCLPQGIDKGSALRRYCARFGATCSAAIGDNALDLPMLEAADVAILPLHLAAKLRNPCRILFNAESPLADQLCALLEEGAAFQGNEIPAQSNVSEDA